MKTKFRTSELFVIVAWNGDGHNHYDQSVVYTTRAGANKALKQCIKDYAEDCECTRAEARQMLSVMRLGDLMDEHDV